MGSHTTHIVCLNFIREWCDLKFNVEPELQIFEKTFHTCLMKIRIEISLLSRTITHNPLILTFSVTMRIIFKSIILVNSRRYQSINLAFIQYNYEEFFLEPSSSTILMSLAWTPHLIVNCAVVFAHRTYVHTLLANKKFHSGLLT